MRDRIMTILLSVLATLILLIPVAYMIYKQIEDNRGATIYAVDLQNIIQERQGDLFRSLSSSELTEEAKTKAAKDTEHFAIQLNLAIEAIAKECDRCIVINKAAMLAGDGAIDITSAVKARLK
jgi:hypothetical protein